MPCYSSITKSNRGKLTDEENVITDALNAFACMVHLASGFRILDELNDITYVFTIRFRISELERIFGVNIQQKLRFFKIKFPLVFISK